VLFFFFLLIFVGVSISAESTFNDLVEFLSKYYELLIFFLDFSPLIVPSDSSHFILLESFGFLKYYFFRGGESSLSNDILSLFLPRRNFFTL